MSEKNWTVDDYGCEQCEVLNSKSEIVDLTHRENVFRVVQEHNALANVEDVAEFLKEVKGILVGGKANATSVYTQDRTKLKLALLAIEEALALFPATEEGKSDGE